ncbi:MAG: hypothetical protein HZC47_06555 [Methanobacterium sp.]|uniref:hypothetical protein n=1 Tax=Methanobacterium sp. TaxID=2164 RepID=UPI003D64D15D|nr:hypothetical protein [Methanobacterium sp.]
MSYIICDKCGGYYELKEGESPDEFDSCQCGGKLRYANYLYGKSYDSNESENKIKEKISGFWNKQNRNGKIVLILLGLFLVVSSTLGVLGKIYPDTSTAQGYLDYHNEKISESTEILKDILQNQKDYASYQISEDEVVQRLNIDKQKTDVLVHDLETIKVPLQYKKHRNLVVSSLKDDSAATATLIDAIKNHDPVAYDTSVSLRRSALDKMEQAVAELKRINNIK